MDARDGDFDDRIRDRIEREEARERERTAFRR
jgi:hypothetical protein